MDGFTLHMEREWLLAVASAPAPPTRLKYIPGCLVVLTIPLPELPPPNNMHQVLNRILFLLLFYSSLATATNLTQCLEDFRTDPNAVGGVDSRGRPAGAAEAVGLTYKTCTARCGGNEESFDWGEFAHSWLPPWLALISQLPYGSGNNVDDLISGNLPPPFTGSIAHPNALPHIISCHKPRIPCSGRLLPRSHLLEHSIGLS